MKLTKNMFFVIFIAPVVYVAMVIHEAYKYSRLKNRIKELTELSKQAENER